VHAERALLGVAFFAVFLIFAVFVIFGVIIVIAFFEVVGVLVFCGVFVVLVGGTQLIIGTIRNALLSRGRHPDLAGMFAITGEFVVALCG
jgi:hypothetical protein